MTSSWFSIPITEEKDGRNKKHGERKGSSLTTGFKQKPFQTESNRETAPQIK